MKSTKKKEREEGEGGVKTWENVDNESFFYGTHVVLFSLRVIISKFDRAITCHTFLLFCRALLPVVTVMDGVDGCV